MRRRRGQTDLVSKVLNNECAVGHAGLLKEGACLQVGVVQLLSPGVVRTFRHLEKTREEKPTAVKKKKDKKAWDHLLHDGTPRDESA